MGASKNRNRTAETQRTQRKPQQKRRNILSAFSASLQWIIPRAAVLTKARLWG